MQREIRTKHALQIVSNRLNKKSNTTLRFERVIQLVCKQNWCSVCNCQMKTKRIYTKGS